MSSKEHRLILRYFYALVFVGFAFGLVLFALNEYSHSIELNHHSSIEEFHLPSIVITQKIFDQLVLEQ